MIIRFHANLRDKTPMVFASCTQIAMFSWLILDRDVLSHPVSHTSDTSWSGATQTKPATGSPSCLGKMYLSLGCFTDLARQDDFDGKLQMLLSARSRFLVFQNPKLSPKTGLDHLLSELSG